MGKCKIILKTQMPLIGAIFAFGISVWAKNKIPTPLINISKQTSAMTLNTDFLKLISAGNTRMVADFVWIKTLLESDLEHYKKDNINNWMFLRFNQISDLDPFFYENYLYGGLYLSIVKDDLYGADDLYSRGIKLYPNDYLLNYYSGFNLYFEIGDYNRGLERLIKIRNDKLAPQTLKFLITKLEFENNKNYDHALAFLKYNLAINDDTYIEDKIKNDIYAIKAEKDLDCLNTGLQNCDKNDEEGVPYQLVNYKWEAKKKYIPYKIHRKKNGTNE